LPHFSENIAGLLNYLSERVYIAI